MTLKREQAPEGFWAQMVGDRILGSCVGCDAMGTTHCTPAGLCHSKNREDGLEVILVRRK